MPEQIRLWTWKVPETSAEITQGMTRQNAFDRGSGQAAFTGDIYLPGMLYAKILSLPGISDFYHPFVGVLVVADSEDNFGDRRRDWFR
jgi:hypothetical protein